MRVDAKSLLTRLGKPELAYREFVDRFSDLELWPIFEALLNDQRLQSIGTAGSPHGLATPTRAPVTQASRDALSRAKGLGVSDTERETLAALFERYGKADATAPGGDSVQSGADVRAILQLLSTLGAEGKL